VYDVKRGTGARLLDPPATRAVWTPDGTRLTFQRRGRLYTVSAAGRDEPKLTLEEDGSVLFPLGWSRRAAFWRTAQCVRIPIATSGCCHQLDSQHLS